MRTDAAILTDVERIEQVSLELPPVKSTELLVEVEATGLCGSDMAVYLGKHVYKTPPIVLGHEFSGVVRQIGEAVTSVKVGDRICAASFSHCGTCDACKRGTINLCRHKRNICHRDWHGSFAHHVVVFENMISTIPPEVDAERGALVEPLTIGLHAMRLPNAIAHKKIVIIGAGNIGLACLLAAKKLDADQVVCIDRGDAKGVMARRLGADGYIDAQTTDVLDALPGDLRFGADITVAACGYDGIFEHAKQLTRPGGDVIVVSYLDPGVTLDANDFLRSELTVRFSYGSTTSDFAEVIGWMSRDGFDPMPLVTHRFSLAEAGHALRLKKERPSDVGKVLFNCAGG